MTKYLLDTNALLWILNDDQRLSPAAREIAEGDEDIFVSDVSFWEIAIKVNIGKLDVKGSIYDIERECRNLDFDRIAIDLEHFERLRTLPLHHQDPFGCRIPLPHLKGIGECRVKRFPHDQAKRYRSIQSCQDQPGKYYKRPVLKADGCVICEFSETPSASDINDFIRFK